MSADRRDRISLEVLTGRTAAWREWALGPSRVDGGDVCGMAGEVARAEPWRHMAEPHSLDGAPAQHAVRSHRRGVVRGLAVVLSLLALLLTSSALNWVTTARAAEDGPKRAVIVSGPVGALTTKYKNYAKDIAAAAEAQGMVVKRLLYPNATPKSVKRWANGADLFVYVGHGNGWPSPFPPFQERTKNGIGISPVDPDKRTPYNVLYKGADWLKANIEFAPNAVVILKGLSYASGNASSGMPIPSRSVAIERVDNYANGFLASGARVVWHLGWQLGADVVNALYQEDATMDAVFMTRYREGVNPLNGWIGWKPGYYASQRVPGAEIHIDPDPTYGYLRAVSGDLSFTTTEWRDASSVPEDTEAPVISDLSAAQAPITVATGDQELPIFTPNGDGLSDSIKIRHTLSEPAFLDVRVMKDGNVVRRMTLWSLRGKGASSWDGRRDDGEYVGEGSFRIAVTPRDRAGNVGETVAVRVKAISALKAPIAMPPLFDPTDGDDLASTTILKAKLIRPGTVSWHVMDSSGAIVRHGLDKVPAQPGPVRFVWDGKDDDGQPLPRGKYTARVRVIRPQGAYGHDIKVRIGPFRLIPSSWSLKRGDSVKLTVVTAEPVKGKVTIVANRKGFKKVKLFVRKINDKKFTARYKTRTVGKAGKLKIRVSSTDKGGGTQTQFFILKLR
ncbi:MAG: FlgD immunoglobulin-like domain containing protein [Chloroflexota bacterium]